MKRPPVRELGEADDKCDVGTAEILAYPERVDKIKR